MSKNRNVIQLPETRKEREYRKFLDYELPTLEVLANIGHSFYSSEGKSITELMAIERKAFNELAYVHSKLPPDKAEKFVEKCLPWWKVMKSLHAAIRELALEDLREQGVVIGKQGTR
jgi:hypothetical protein